MISFESDYNNGVHPEILKRFIDTNTETSGGYGSDQYTISAIEKIKTACECEEAQVYLAVGGTQTNQLVISTMLKGYEGVVAATTGHVATHEAGAIEYSGSKVLTIPSHMGKIDADELAQYVQGFYDDGNHEHMIFPGMVYISHPTEYGSLYTLEELKNIYAVCKKFDMSLYIDGARLAYGLTGKDTDVTLPDIAKYSDVFYIGGTKAGALCGEAIVFTKNNMPKHFLTLAKKRGALLAKGRVLGIQFDAFFTDDLYYRCGKNANDMKDKMVAILKNANMNFFYESPTNQQFIILDNETYEKLSGKVAISFWEQYDSSHVIVRFATSWATTEDDIKALEKVLKEELK